MKKQPEMLTEQKKSVLNCVLVIVCALFAAIFLFNLWFRRQFLVVEVSGGSMETTLQSGDILYADRYRTPERGDVVIIDVSDLRMLHGFSGDYIIKRVIGLEGDTVKCVDGELYLRRAGSDEFFLLQEDYLETRFPNEDFDEVTVGRGEIFFMGDHRDSSKDSRSVGCLELTRVVGVVPEWVIAHKSLINAWEKFRSGLGGNTTQTEE